MFAKLIFLFHCTDTPHVEKLRDFCCINNSDKSVNMKSCYEVVSTIHNICAKLGRIIYCVSFKPGGSLMGVNSGQILGSNMKYLQIWMDHEKHRYLSI